MLPQLTQKRGRRASYAKRPRPFADSTFTLPLSGPLQLPDLALDHLALERRGVVYEDYTVAVVRLVQHAASGQFHAVHLEEVTVYVVRADDGAEVALDREEDAGERQTAFFA